MTKDEIIEMAKQVGFNVNDKLIFDDAGCTTITNRMESFAKLVAERAAAKERKEICGTVQLLIRLAQLDERERICAGLRQFHDTISLASDSNAIRARGEMK